MPRFGHRTRLPVFVAPDLLQENEVWAAAGTRHHVLPSEAHTLVEASGGCITDLKR